MNLQSRIAAFCLAFSLLGVATAVSAHDHDEPPQATIAPSTQVMHTDHGHLYLLQLSAEPATVGELTRIKAVLQDDHGAQVPATFKLEVSNLEDHDQVLTTALAAPSGRIDWREQFYDGDEHEIVVSAVPTGDAKPVAVAKIKLPVTAIPPPRPVIWRTFFYLMSVTAAALALAYLVTTRKLAAG